MLKFIHWFSKYLKKQKKHTTIYDRDGISPYMERYYILWRNRPNWVPFNMFLHNLRRSDEDDLHDHPWGYITFILAGGYWETTPEGKYWRGPGHIRIRRAESLHKLEIDATKGEVWTLFIPFKRHREWGFVRNNKWIPWRRYINEKRATHFNS